MFYQSQIFFRKNLFLLTIHNIYKQYIQYHSHHELQFLLFEVKPTLKLRETLKNLYLLKWDTQKKRQLFLEMDAVEKQKLLQQVKADYTQILINYFTADKTIKEKIDKFVNLVFCAKIPVPQIIEIHMELIDDFSKQLKLEGRSDEALLDYRLTLIDILAHLCEAYRCSIPK